MIKEKEIQHYGGLWGFIASPCFLFFLFQLLAPNLPWMFSLLPNDDIVFTHHNSKQALLPSGAFLGYFITSPSLNLYLLCVLVIKLLSLCKQRKHCTVWASPSSLKEIPWTINQRNKTYVLCENYWSLFVKLYYYGDTFQGKVKQYLEYILLSVISYSLGLYVAYLQFSLKIRTIESSRDFCCHYTRQGQLQYHIAMWAHMYMCVHMCLCVSRSLSYNNTIIYIQIYIYS